MTGGGRAPAVAHERAEKQDLGLDASSHFAGEGVLHSLTGLLRRRRMGGGCFCQANPSLASLEPHSFYHFTSSTLFFRENVCSLTEQCGSGRVTEAHQPRRNSRAFGCWVQAPLKGWNERGNMWPLFFLTKKALSSTKIRLYCASKAAKIPKHQNKQHTMQKYNRKCSCIVVVCSAASAVSLVAAF